ncbi:MAG: hypothetical protein ACJAT1_001426 [Marivirga sp.]|jgi:hypothetical protein
MSQNYRIFKEWPCQTEYDQCDISIFLQKSFWEIQINDAQTYPLCMRDQKGELIAFCCFAKLASSWKSPYFAPYSRIFATSSVTYDIYCVLALDYLQQAKASPLDLFLPANYPYPTLFGQSRQIKQVEISHQLPVNQANNLMMQIRESEKIRRLKKLKAKAYITTELAGEDFQPYYKILLDWRAQKGHKNPIPLSTLTKLKEQFPTNYHFIRLQKEKQLLGLAIFIQENNDTIYTYIVLSNPFNTADEYTLLLWDKIYEVAKSLGVKNIDMGTAMLDGKINKGLASYKTSIGGQTARKYNFLTC